MVTFTQALRHTGADVSLSEGQSTSEQTLDITEEGEDSKEEEMKSKSCIQMSFSRVTDFTSDVAMET